MDEFGLRTELINLRVMYRKLKKRAELLEALALGCPIHREYRYVRRPRTDCARCWRLYDFAREVGLKWPK